MYQASVSGTPLLEDASASSETHSYQYRSTSNADHASGRSVEISLHEDLPEVLPAPAGTEFSGYFDCTEYKNIGVGGPTPQNYFANIIPHFFRSFFQSFAKPMVAPGEVEALGGVMATQARNPLGKGSRLFKTFGRRNASQMMAWRRSQLFSVACLMVIALIVAIPAIVRDIRAQRARLSTANPDDTRDYETALVFIVLLLFVLDSVATMFLFAAVRRWRSLSNSVFLLRLAFITQFLAPFSLSMVPFRLFFSNEEDGDIVGLYESAIILGQVVPQVITFVPALGRAASICRVWCPRSPIPGALIVATPLMRLPMMWMLLAVVMQVIGDMWFLSAIVIFVLGPLVGVFFLANRLTSIARTPRAAAANLRRYRFVEYGCILGALIPIVGFLVTNVGTSSFPSLTFIGVFAFILKLMTSWTIASLFMTDGLVQVLMMAAPGIAPPDLLREVNTQCVVPHDASAQSDII